MSLPALPGFVPVVVSLLSLASIFQGAQSHCGGCHNQVFIGSGAIAAAMGLIGGVVLKRER